MARTTPSVAADACFRSKQCALEALKLAEALAQIEELIDANRRLRSELTEMTLMWVVAQEKDCSPARQPHA